MMQQQAMAPQSCCCSSPDCALNGCAIQRRAQQQQKFYQPVPNWQQQMGTDPQSKLADAINRLCDLIEKS